MSKALTTEELIKKMAWHVSREVKHYATDFEIDRAQLTEAVETGRYGQYIWITRTCGTYLVPVGIAATDPDRSAWRWALAGGLRSRCYGSTAWA